MKFNKKVLIAALAIATTEAFVPSFKGTRSPAFASPLIEPQAEVKASSTSLNLFAKIKRESATEKDIRSLFNVWNDALATGDSDAVAKLYAPDGFLLPTVSDVPRTDYDSIKDYFDNFLKLKPQGVIKEGKIKIGRNWAKDAGIYEFTMGATGAKVEARYSFIYVFEDGEWKISHHHSSAMPEQMMAKGEDITDEEVRDLFGRWNSALATLNPAAVANRYSKNAVLLPTVSDEPRTDYESIKDYFVNFLDLKPQGEILESHVTVGNNWAKDAGIYEFVMGKDGSKVKARYSFVYVFEDGDWKISHHHSSMMPESAASKKSISEEEVKDLFNVWNSALDTLDSDAVAMRYSKNAVLLPTVSDTPRTDYDSIKDYFDNFLKLKPQGKILESHTVVGDDWAKDVGIYEFTMRSDGSKVKARYSFVYVFEDGEWKISHHHSSAMPEKGISQGKLLEKKEVQNLFGRWNSALGTLNPDTVARRYSKDAVLLPTVSDEPRTDYDSIKDYFVNFLDLQPQGEILESHVVAGPNWAKDAGIYEFTMGKDGSKVKARYSFVYVYEDGDWKISHHHSSMMPESTTAMTEKLSEGEVKELFGLWNDALATLDSDAVAMRYSKNSVLLPTVSDTPRTDYDSKKDYFDNFLKLKPQGKILESHAVVGDGWCKDVGIYEFTMGSDGSKVKARYSFVYVFEDGEWKISHHHSSQMPESVAPKGVELSKSEVQGLFGLWNDALDTLNPDTVAKRYSKDAVLLPTVSDVPRTDYDGIKDYFVNFLDLKPQGVILESHVKTGPNWAKDAGIYEFTMGKDGSKVKARYSFVYVYEDGEWKISHHHSSKMPESSAATTENISEDQVKELFSLWNDALATLDSDAVAMRYAKKAVLLPTVSDTPRTDYDSIKNYFDSFLEKQPQGKILDSYALVGDNWCKDVGIYEFTMGADGSKVQARYSFVYVFEDGEWKISHHHSSVMPESYLGSPDASKVEESVLE